MDEAGRVRMPPEKGEAMLPEYDRSGMTGAKKQLLKEIQKSALGTKLEPGAMPVAGSGGPQIYRLLSRSSIPRSVALRHPGFWRRSSYASIAILFRSTGRRPFWKTATGFICHVRTWPAGMGLATDWLRPIYEHIRTGVMAGGYLQIDETPIP